MFCAQDATRAKRRDHVATAGQAEVAPSGSPPSAGDKYTIAMRIPHTQPSPAALRAVVAEFVTRDGTDYSSVEPRIDKVLRQLDNISAHGSIRYVSSKEGFSGKYERSQ